jgi:hypothetical protein
MSASWDVDERVENPGVEVQDVDGDTKSARSDFRGHSRLLPRTRELGGDDAYTGTKDASAISRRRRTAGLEYTGLDNMSQPSNEHPSQQTTPEVMFDILDPIRMSLEASKNSPRPTRQ